MKLTEKALNQVVTLYTTNKYVYKRYSSLVSHFCKDWDKDKDKDKGL